MLNLKRKLFEGITKLSILYYFLRKKTNINYEICISVKQIILGGQKYQEWRITRSRGIFPKNHLAIVLISFCPIVRYSDILAPITQTAFKKVYNKKVKQELCKKNVNQKNYLQDLFKVQRCCYFSLSLFYKYGVQFLKVSKVG